MSQIRPIQITSTTNGYIVTVGCMTLVFQKPFELMDELRRYLNDPAQIEAEYVKQYGGGPPGLNVPIEGHHQFATDMGAMSTRSPQDTLHPNCSDPVR